MARAAERGVRAQEKQHMSEIINEALLEMHFHRAIVENFSKHYNTPFLKLLKPSPKQEAWVGFDQGWVQTSLTTRELFAELKDTIRTAVPISDSFYFGFFLQFKIVERVARDSRYKPDHYSVPYLRSKLDLSPNKTTGISQHETLLLLNRIPNTVVSYACGMLFDISDIQEAPSVDKLRCVDISNSPLGWATNQQHFITFQTETDPTPFWCSDPIKGESHSFNDWAFNRAERSPIKFTGDGIYKQIQTTLSVLREINTKRIKHLEADFKRQDHDPVIRLLPPSFTLLQFAKRSEE